MQLPPKALEITAVEASDGGCTPFPSDQGGNVRIALLALPSHDFS